MIPRTIGRVGQRIEFKGSAYDFGRSIAAIEFSLDRGEHWTRYDTPGTNDYQNVCWAFVYTPRESGLHVLYIRSLNEAGTVSPEAAYAELLVE